MKILFLVLIALIGGAVNGVALNAWYFQYRTGMPLMEILTVKSKCESRFYQHCTFIYYYMPDRPVKQVFIEPDKTEL